MFIFIHHNGSKEINKKEITYLNVDVSTHPAGIALLLTVSGWDFKIG